MHTSRAFSLLELVMVVAVVGVIAAIAVPSFAVLSEGRRLELAQSRIEHELGSWIEHAKLKETGYVVRFDQGANTCWLLPEGWSNLRQAEESIDFSDRPFEIAIATRSNDADETDLTIDRRGVVGGDLELQLVAGDVKAVISLP